MTTEARAGFSLSAEAFRTWLRSRMDAGESKVAIGRSLGVSGMAVSQWLSGRAGVSQTVLILAHRLQREQAGSWPAIDL